MRFSAGVGIIAAMIITAVMSSCAKAEIEDTTKLEKLAFDAWVEKYVKGKGIDVVRQSNGIYVEFLEDGDQSVVSPATHDTITRWMRLQYTATDIEGNVFVTRDSLEALRQRSFTPYTYYVPDYLWCGDFNDGSMSEGLYFALRNALTKPDGSTMRVTLGSRVKIYVPSYLAYSTNGFSDDQGYGGQYPLGSTGIMIQDLTVKEVIDNPVDRESEMVTHQAKDVWGLSDADTIATLLFVDTLNFRPRESLLADFPEKEYLKEYAITSDSTVNVWFVGRFLPSAEYPDGFIFDTNIEAVHDEFYNRRALQNYLPQDKTFTAISYTAGSTDSSGNYPAALKEAIPKLRQGQWSRLVFTSAYGYGSTGLSAKLTKLQAAYDSYMDYYLYSSMQNAMYGGSSYYNNYYNNSYYSGNGYNYYNSSMSTSSSSSDEQSIITEVQPYTPLILEVYIETGGH